MKAVTFFTTDSKPRTGGIANYLHALCEGLSVLGFQVSMRSCVEGAAEVESLRYTVSALGARISRNKKYSDQFYITRKWNTLEYIRRLEKQALVEIAGAAPRERVVIASWGFEPHFWCRACQTLNIPYVLIGYGAELLNTLPPFYAAWRRRDLKKAAHLVAISRASASLIKTISGREPVIVTPVVRASECVPVEASRIADRRRTLGIGPETIVLLTVGRLIERKGVELVLRSLRELLKNFPDLIYVVAGDGPEKAKLERLSAELGIDRRVRFIGKVRDDEKWLLYRLCDIFVTPNRTLGGREFEGFGIVFIEAALSSKPSIGGDNGGVRDAIVDGETGFVVDTDLDEKPLTDALAKLLSDPARRAAIGAAARQRAVSMFSEERMAQIFADSCLS